jgi:hypothetical protein
MALFTPEEASGTTISRCQAVFSDTGSTQLMYYVFAVTDENRVNYNWKNFSLPAGADNTTIKDSIYNHLISGVTKTYPNTDSTISDESIIGDNPG